MKQYPMNDQEAVSNILNTIDCIRTKQGLSLSRLAFEANVSENTVKYIFKKRGCPTIPTLIRLCEALHISLWEFFLLASLDKMQPHKEYELLLQFEKLDIRYKDLIIYIASYLSK